MTGSLWQRTACDLADDLQAGEVSSEAVVEACLARIGAQDEALRAFVTVDAESALREARRLDAMAARGLSAGPLHGLPFAVKDLTATRGMRTTMGSRRHENDVPEQDDIVVARLRAAGAVLVGKTNTPEFGFGALCDNELRGNTVNPYDRSRSSGGSSGGAAVAAATGMVPLSLGTDFGGSCRTPAAFCNVVGLRPGFGRVPKIAKNAMFETMATYGTLTRSVADARLMLSAMAGADSLDPASRDLGSLDPVGQDPTRLRIGWTPDLGIASVSADIRAAFGTAIGVVSAAGPSLEACTPDFSGAQDAFETLRASMLFHDFGAALGSGAPMSETVRWNIERGRGVTARDHLAAEAVRYKIFRNCVDFFDRFDFLLLPATSVPPFRLDAPDVTEIDGKPLRNIVDYLTVTYAISLVGLPAISIPCGATASGLPVGLQIVAGPHRERDLLAFAAYLETACGFRHVFPEAW